ncbi:Gfo/Idh/MocA family oxidoreductase [Paenibacillus thalictri]|uniref:Gfo/Idh/MocA family oxidoreductase n=1 Tax=Paenibacillus thalictri TaxID=2527873 RepID=A0A4Q9DN74_9BACL|nr:Gfo/Idh/MocA family oxidoreductase [Paenibacillus thalictri]TBL73893.1 Gfo/Idh/MocA family oxidoreductase [Paenibacillus thalictri]
MTDGRKLKVGVLGCGPISQAAHFDACRKAANTELYAICDVAEDLVARMQAVHEPAVAYTEYERMLADPMVELVVIGIADQYHVPMALKALEAGKHVLIEKPLGVSIEECEMLQRQVERSGLVLQVGNMKRFDPGITYAREFIAGEMGEMLALKAWYCDSTYRYTMTDNVMPVIRQSVHARKPGGNPKQNKQRYYMLTHGSHLVDTARFLGGEIVSVRARHVQKFGAYCWFVEAEFASGALGHLDLTVAVRMDWHEGFEVYGEHGSVTAKTYNPWLFKASDVEVFSVKDGVYRRPLGADAHFYKLQLQSLAETILDGAPVRGATVEDGMAAMRAMAAIARSVESGEKVVLSEVYGEI